VLFQKYFNNTIAHLIFWVAVCVAILASILYFYQEQVPFIV